MEPVDLFGETRENALYRHNGLYTSTENKSVHLTRDRQRSRVLLARGKRTYASVHYEKIQFWARTSVIGKNGPPVKV